MEGGHEDMENIISGGVVWGAGLGGYGEQGKVWGLYLVQQLPQVISTQICKNPWADFLHIHGGNICWNPL